MGFVKQGRILWAVVCFLWSASDTTTGQVLWPDYALNSTLSGVHSFLFFTSIPFTYYESISTAVQFKLGYVIFGSDYRGTQPPPPAEWPANPKILAMYWTPVQIDEDKARYSAYYYYNHQRLMNNVTYENSLIKLVKSIIPEADFEPLVILAATWTNFTPVSQKNDTAAFQVILATDSQVTYAIRVYESVWKSPELANQTYYAGTYSRGYGESPNASIPGSQKGPEVIRLGTKNPNKDAYTCVAKTQTAIARLNSSLYLLPPCPCFQVQAARDQQFNMSNTYPNCYQSVSPPPGGSLLQICCYSQYGVLVNYTKEARVPVSADPNDRSLQEAFESCCADGSNLCEWFYYRIPINQCANYTPAINASELPSFANSLDDRVLKSQDITTTVEFSFRNTSSVKLRAATNFNSSHGFGFYSRTFTWDVGAGRNELRKMSYPQWLVFYVTDANNMSGSYAPIYKLCLCEQDEQCDLNSFSIADSRERLGIRTFTGLDTYERGNVNSMMCNCKGKATGRFCEKPINACDNCLIQNSPACDANSNASCIPCPVGYQRDGTQCREQALWQDYALYSNPSGPGGILYFTSIPFTYYESITNTVDFNFGYVTFGSDYRGTQPPPPAEWPANPKILAIYWTSVKIDTDNARRSSYIYYESNRLDNNVTYENSLIQYVKRVINETDFEPLVIIAATWKNITPISQNNDTATFQVILATDSQVTYAIRGYDSVWKSPELANQTYYAATYSRGYGERPNISIPGSQKGAEVIRLGTKKPNRDAYTCVAKTQTAISRLNSSLYLLPPCPCFQVQAAKDTQFNMSNTYPNCYQSVSPPTGGSLLQLCCYSQYGVLVNYIKEARVPVSAVPNDRSLQEAFESCCADGSGLCDWFYYRIPMITCANYTPAVNASELPSFYTSDNERVHKSQVAYAVAFSFRNTSSAIFRAATNFNSSHGFSVGTTGYTWDLRAGRYELRKVSYPQRLVFYVTDANNMSGSYAPIYKLCLCEQDEQCDLNAFSIADTRQQLGMRTFTGLDTYEQGNVNSMVCNCKGNGTGRFCEKPINACDNCLIQSSSVCGANPQDYCPSCPVGYQRDGTQCQAMASTPNTTPSRGDNNHSDSPYLVIILSCVAAFTMWIQNPLASHI